MRRTTTGPIVIGQRRTPAWYMARIGTRKITVSVGLAGKPKPLATASWQWNPLFTGEQHARIVNACLVRIQRRLKRRIQYVVYFDVADARNEPPIPS